MSKDKRNLPKAATLMGSLRSMGYSFESAIADIIDNSVSAHAKNIKILFPQTPLEEIAVGILDDGLGMSNVELFEAMRYGSMASEEERDEDDLGRFGMGLKSASLSQCRKLTVVSYDNMNQLSAYQWDYTYIIEKKDWIIKELYQKEIKMLPYFNLLKNQSCGTLVIWEDFDLISKASAGQVYNTLCDLRVSLENTLSLIFHRYLDDTITMYIDNLKLLPQDPFLEKHPKTTSKKERTIAITDSNGIERLIRIKPFVLPYATDLKEKDKKLLGGIDNLRAKQGFYVYRNKRLIIWGTWFGMKQRGELTKNARIRVDIPNSLDDIWSIDIKKQRAAIPKQILNQLRNTVNEALEISVNKQNYRGRTNKIDENIDYVWDRKEGRDNTYFYVINRESHLFQYIKSQIDEKAFIFLEMLITEVENNFPIQQMYIDKSNEAISPKDESDSRLDDVYQLALSMVNTLININNESKENAIDNLMKSEPFCHYPKIKKLLINNLD